MEFIKNIPKGVRAEKWGKISAGYLNVKFFGVI